ncbi:hypothetical protein [Laspinema palackyanum]|uniref:hypothetical protein n=1 Tax=Laspinema palackyanum TaxID=3231601 RepID=UPI00345CBFC6|nr:hypothetical protein [Laspinema sp. D2c]
MAIRLGRISLNSTGGLPPGATPGRRRGNASGKPRTLDIGATSRQGANGEGSRKRIESAGIGETAIATVGLPRSSLIQD